MYAQAKVKRNIIPRNVAHRIVNRGVQKCTCAGASLRSKKCAPLNCINLDTATDKAVARLIQGIPQKGLISGLFADGRPMRSYFFALPPGAKNALGA